jgi:hypothetical protein
MRPQPDPIALYRHVLRAGDLSLAGKLGRILVRDPEYRDRVLAELDGLPWGTKHVTPAGQLLDLVMARLDPLGDT